MKITYKGMINLILVAGLFWGCEKEEKNTVFDQQALDARAELRFSFLPRK
jgi:hypothetical protein